MGRFQIHLIKPTRYDDDGYPLQWWRSIIPSNSLACMAGIVEDAIARGALAGVACDVHAVDEINGQVDPARFDYRDRAITLDEGDTLDWLADTRSTEDADRRRARAAAAA